MDLQRHLTQNNHRQPTALVVGAAGFVGRHTCRALAASGCAVIGIGHGRWTAQEAAQYGIDRWIEADITLEALIGLDHLDTVDCVVHCAGSGAVSFSYSDPWQDFQRATVTTAAVLEWVRRREQPRPRLVVVSSAAVYGDQGDTDSTETSIRSPISPYGFHKLAAESLCESASRFFDVPVSIVRLFSVYGEGLRKQLLWDAMSKFSRGEDQFFGTGHELRDWLHVDDAAKLLSAAALAPQSRFEIFNGANQQATTAQVLQQLAAVSFPSVSPHFNGETHTGNPRRLTANCDHACRLLAWAPQVDLAEGLRRYAEWFLRQRA